MALAPNTAFTHPKLSFSRRVPPERNEVRCYLVCVAPSLTFEMILLSIVFFEPSSGLTKELVCLYPIKNFTIYNISILGSMIDKLQGGCKMATVKQLLNVKGDGTNFMANAGTSYLFDSNEVHGLEEVCEPSEVIECFVPMRPEYA